MRNRKSTRFRIVLAQPTCATPAFAIGGKTGATTNPLRVLLCTESVRTGGLLSQCVVAP